MGIDIPIASCTSRARNDHDVPFTDGFYANAVNCR